MGIGYYLMPLVLGVVRIQSLADLQTILEPMGPEGTL